MGKHKQNGENYKTLRDTLTSRPDGKYASECIVHLERTLDEAYFPGLPAGELAIRNSDQVVSGKFKANLKFPRSDIPILIVPQLWLWRAGHVVISAHSTRDCQPHPSPTMKHARLQVGLVMAHYITGFGDSLKLTDGTKVPPTLDLFESRVTSILSEAKEYIEKTKRSAIDYDKEADFHHVLSDCRSELAMIQHFLMQQEEILDQFLSDRSQDEERKVSRIPDDDVKCRPRPRARSPPADWRPVEDAQKILKQYQQRVQKIDGDAERIEKNVQDLLDLKRTYASVQMSQASVRLAQTSVKDSHASVLLSVAAIGFAIVTIIFAPLAFLVGLFALNFQSFDSLRVNQRGAEGKQAGVVCNAGDDGDIKYISKIEPAYHGGKIAGIFSK
jgi:signal transduction histidine kinase